MLRDFGFTLGPAVIGAIALSRAAAEISGKVGSESGARQALATFNGAAAARARRAEAGARSRHRRGELRPAGRERGARHDHAAHRQTVPFNPLKDVAFHALGHAYSIGYLVCGLAALVAALLAAAALPASRTGR